MTLQTITYGQIAYEAYRKHTGGRSLVSSEPLPAWELLPASVQGGWNAAGAAVDDTLLRDGIPFQPDQLVWLRESIENLAAGLDLSADSTAPSKKSEIEAGIARSLRDLLAGPR